MKFKLSEIFIASRDSFMASLGCSNFISFAFWLSSFTIRVSEVLFWAWVNKGFIFLCASEGCTVTQNIKIIDKSFSLEMKGKDLILCFLILGDIN